MTNSSSVNGTADKPVVDTLVVRNRLEELEPLGEWLKQRAVQLGFSQRGIFRLDLVLAEAVTNIIENAYTDDSLHDITINIAHDNDRTVVVSITDDGRKFDPLQEPEVKLPQQLQEARIGGLGVHLMRQYTDQCTYQRRDNKNVLILTFDDNDNDSSS